MKIDYLISIVANGGIVKTGVDIINKDGVLLIERDMPVDDVKILNLIKKNGIVNIPISEKNGGGVWDRFGNQVMEENIAEELATTSGSYSISEIERRVNEIEELKQDAFKKHKRAKKEIKRIFDDIRLSKGRFEYQNVRDTVTDLFKYLTRRDGAFLYLSREIFSFDDYLCNHSVNVCTIGSEILRKFNEHFGKIVNNYLESFPPVTLESNLNSKDLSFVYYLPEELHDMAIGFLLHDIGKAMIPEEVLNKKGKLTQEEFELIKRHTSDLGIKILEKNVVMNPYIKSIIKYHHSPLFKGESQCYPNDKLPVEIPVYVKICKLVDIYDAMTSKRAYSEAYNPIGVVTELFRRYAKKDRMLQFVLHAFVKTVGIYPPGSIVYLVNRQMVYIIDSDGPIVIPFTDTHGQPLKTRPDPINLSDSVLRVDRREPLIPPAKAYNLLPSYLQKSFQQKKTP